MPTPSLWQLKVGTDLLFGLARPRSCQYERSHHVLTYLVAKPVRLALTCPAVLGVVHVISDTNAISGISQWQAINPDKHHDWLGQRTGEFSTYLPMGSKDAKKGIGNAMFRMYSSGVVTARDMWAYNTFESELVKNMKRHIDYCNENANKKPNYIDSKRGKWDSELSRNLKKFGKQKFTRKKIRQALYWWGPR